MATQQGIPTPPPGFELVGNNTPAPPPGFNVVSSGMSPMQAPAAPRPQDWSAEDEDGFQTWKASNQNSKTPATENDREYYKWLRATVPASSHEQLFPPADHSPQQIPTMVDDYGRSLPGLNAAPAAPPASMEAVISRGNSNFIDFLRRSIANSALGHSLQQTMPKVAEATGLTPTETVYDPNYAAHKEQLVAPEYLIPQDNHSAGANLARGALRGAGALTSAPAMATMAAAAATGGLAAPALPALGQVISAAFGAQTATDLLQRAPYLAQQWQAGDREGVLEELGRMGFDAAMLKQMLTHAAGEQTISPDQMQTARGVRQYGEQQARLQGLPFIADQTPRASTSAPVEQSGEQSAPPRVQPQAPTPAEIPQAPRETVSPQPTHSAIPEATAPQSQVQAPPPPPGFQVQPERVSGADGKDSALLTPSGKTPSQYRLVEAGEVVPSHNAQTFAPNPAYPQNVQERTYHTSKEAQARVIQQAQQYDPTYTVNTNPDAVNGPPVVTPGGIVLGGNSRAMSTQRLYGAGSGEVYRSYLREHATEFGFTPEQVDGMRAPMLVREIPEPQGPDAMRRLAADMNKSMTGALGISERAVSAGRNISPESLRQISDMREQLGDESTLRDLLRDRGKQVLDLMLRDGVITDRERPQFIDTATGGLSEPGKTFVERALLGSVVDDPVLMDRTPKSILGKVEGSLGNLAELAGREDEYNILPLLRAAIAEHADIAQRGSNVDLHLGQAAMFGPERNPAVDALIRFLGNKPKDVRAGIRQFAADAKIDIPNQGLLAILQKPSAARAFNEAFGANLTDEQLLTGLRSAISKESRYGERVGRATEGAAAPAEGLQANSVQRAPRGASERVTGNRAGEGRSTLQGEEPATTFGLTIPGIPEGIRRTSAVGKRVADLIGKEAERVRESRELQEGIYNLESQRQADVLRATKVMQGTPGTAKDFEAIYHWQENPREAITPEQRQIYDKTIRPITAENERIYRKLRDGGMPIENYVHRVVQDRGGFLDRILQGQRQGSGSRNVLSTYASAAKSRNMLAIEDAEGNRYVVSQGDHLRLFQPGREPVDIGSYSGGLVKPEPKAPLLEGAPADTRAERFWKDKYGKTWKLTQATTKEIEASTPVRYYHNALASTLTNFLELRRAERAYDFLESFKASPQFKAVAFERGTGAAPKGWREVNLPQFRDYLFRPHEAEVLNWFAKKLHPDPPGLYQKIGDFMRTAIFFNPLIHIPNISVHWTVEKGARGWLPDQWATSYRAGLRAIDAVIHQNKDFLQALDVGAPLQSQRYETQQLTKLFFEKMATELGSNPSVASKVASALGYANPARLVRAVYRFSGKATWLSNDIAFLQAAYEKTARGMSLKDAITETGKHIPTYRLPTRIFDSPAVAKLMANPNLTMFGAYHYGALKSYGQMLKSVVAKDSSPAERAHGLDLLAFTGLVTFVLYPQVDQLLKAVTGNQDAELRRAGAATFPYNLYLLSKGEKSVGEALTASVTPAVLPKMAGELAFNRDLQTGRKVYDQHAPASTLAWQVGNKVAGSVAPVGVAGRMTEGYSEAQKAGLGMLGVGFRKHGAERIAQEIAASKLPQTAPTPEERSRAILKRNLIDAAEKGNLQPADDALASGQINKREHKALLRASQGFRLVDTVRNFNYDDFMKVYDAATPEQKDMLEIMRAQKSEFSRRSQQEPNQSGNSMPPFLRMLTGRRRGQPAAK